MAFGITPTTPDSVNGDNPPVTSEGFPRFIQFQAAGSDLGGPDVDTVNFGDNLTATRGTGENANRVTVAAAAAGGGGGGSETPSLVVQLVGAGSGVFNDNGFSDWLGTVLCTSTDASWNEASNRVDISTAGLYSVRIVGRITSTDGFWPGGSTAYGSRLFNGLPADRSAYTREVNGTYSDDSPGYVQFTDEFVVSIAEEDLPDFVTPQLYGSTYLQEETATFQAVVIVKRLGAVSPPGPTFQLNSTFAAMTFAAEYQALYPEAIDLGSAMDSASTGTNLSLSGGDLLVACSGTGTSLSLASTNTPGTVVWEFKILSMAAGAVYSCGYTSSINVESTPFEESPAQGFDSYFSDGGTEDHTGGDIATAWSVGDSIAFVYESSLARIVVWHNGSIQTTLPVANAGGFAYCAREP